MLERAVRSALRQIRQPSEIIVVDDADDSRSRLVTDALAQSAGPHGPRVRYVVNDQGRGASSSRNLGVHHACGEVVALLDDDDYWAAKYLAVAVQRLVTNGVDAVFTWRADGDRPMHRPYRDPSDGLTVRHVIVRNPGVVGSNICIVREAYERIGGFDVELPVSNDIDFFVRLLDAGCRYSVVRERLVLVGNLSESRLTDSDDRRVEGMRRYLEKHRPRMHWWQRAEMRRRMERVRLQARYRATLGWRRWLYAIGVLALTRPQGRSDIAYLCAMIGGVARLRRPSAGKATDGVIRSHRRTPTP